MFNCLVLLQYVYPLWVLVSLNPLGTGRAQGLIEFQKKASPPPCPGETKNGALSLVYSNRELSLVLKSWLLVKAVWRAVSVFLCPNNGTHSSGKFLIWHFHNSLPRPLAVSSVWMCEMQLLLVNAENNSCLERFVSIAFEMTITVCALISSCFI